MRACVLFLVCPLPRVRCLLPRPTVLLPALPDVHLSAQREVQVQLPVRVPLGDRGHIRLRDTPHMKVSTTLILCAHKEIAWGHCPPSGAAAQPGTPSASRGSGSAPVFGRERPQSPAGRSRRGPVGYRRRPPPYTSGTLCYAPLRMPP